MRVNKLFNWIVPVTILVFSGGSAQPGELEHSGVYPGNQIVQEEESQADTAWKEAARRMVREQIQARGVRDQRVLETLRTTPRHRFVPPGYERTAYSDSPLPIGKGQTISQPYIVALMTELLQLKGAEKVLEIGTGSGYQAAILAPLVGEVYSIEIIQSLADQAREKLNRLGYRNVTVKWGDGYQGWPQEAPFDRIIVTAAPDEVPAALVEQLAVGGRMVIPVGKFWQELKVVIKNRRGRIREETIIPVRFVPMVHPTEPIPEQKP